MDGVFVAPAPQAFVGVVVEGGLVGGYVCDGQGDRATVASWFRGSLVDKRFAVAGDDGVQVEGIVEGAALSGTVTLADDTAYPFEGEHLADDELDRGLFRTEGTVAGNDVLAGWIVDLPEQRGAARIGGGIQVAPPYDPFDPDLTVSVGGGSERLPVIRVSSLADLE
jgi:hypothetical protein